MTDHGSYWNSFLQIATISDIGMRRTNNQDNLAVSLSNNLERWRERGHLFVVADGMGAHAAGEFASEVACDQVPQLYSKFDQVSPPEALKKAVVEANAIINRKGQANEEFFNMGTTCSALLILPQGAVVAHVGDSRVYMLRNQELNQLTADHSLVWEMRAGGHLSADDEAANFIPKNVITRSLGPYPDVKVDLEGPFPTQKGDAFLLCSDGLTGLVNDEEIGTILATMPPDDAVQFLTDLTNLRGGPDNITIIVVKIIHHDLTTQQSSNQPLTVRTKKIKPAHPLAWACFAGLALATVILGITTRDLTATLVPGVGTAIALIWILVQKGGVSAGVVEVGKQQRFGKGPYVRAKCVAGESLVSKLKVISDELRSAAKISKFDTEKTDAVLLNARTATEASRFSDAVREYARAISTIMDQIRRKSGNQASGSAVDL